MVDIMTNILNAIINRDGGVDITISGTSMEPVLHSGMQYRLIKSDRYIIGDILVYKYKDEGLLAHRLLKLQYNRYFCKGDNSFRLEDIQQEQIIGKIDIIEDANNNSEFIEASYKISRLFRRCGYSHEKIQKREEYIEYREKYLSENG